MPCVRPEPLWGNCGCSCMDVCPRNSEVLKHLSPPEAPEGTSGTPEYTRVRHLLYRSSECPPTGLKQMLDLHLDVADDRQAV